MAVRLAQLSQLMILAGSAVRDTVRRQLNRSDVDGVAVYESGPTDAERFGRRAFRPFGPGCRFKTALACVESPMNAKPIGGVQLPTKVVKCYFVKPNATTEEPAQANDAVDSRTACDEVSGAEAAPDEVVIDQDDPDTAGQC